MVVGVNSVFMSFNRCEDIRYSFLSHLSAEFNRKGISCEDPTSDHVRDPKEVEADIDKSKVSLVILSEKYASDTQCLNQLLKLSVFRNREENGLVVIPVFYGLTKPELRKQCLELKKKYRNDECWRNALLEIADLPGHASSLERSDSELVEEIVADVRQKLDRTTSKIGVYSRLMKIENLLSKQRCGIRSLGIWGMGGIGKTTLAEAAFEQLLLSSEFEASCFIKDFDNAYQEKGVYGLLEEHLGKKLGLRTSHFTREKLRGKRILLVLDDVHKPLGATNFLSWFGSGSLIIITSRDKQLLVQCRVNDIYEVQGLNKHEALELIRRSGSELTHYQIEKLLEDANGNPLALNVLGRELVEGISTSTAEMKFFDVLKRSYDALSESEKEIFLHIVFSFRGENVDNVMQFLERCGFFPRIGIDALVNKSWVTISNNKLQMHNLIYDFGIKVIKDKGEDDQIGMCYKFLDDSNIQSIQEDNEIKEDGELDVTVEQGNEDIKAISLDTSKLDFKGHIVLRHMYNLRYLKIHCSDEKEEPEFCLPGGDPQPLPPELRLLHWEYYPWQSFPQDLDVQHLVELYMPYSKLRKLWGGTKNLEVLKRITLSHSLQLVNVDELQHSQNIEMIDLQECSSLESFPDMGQSQQLRVVNLSNCIEIKNFPKVPASVMKLHLQGTGIQELSSSLNHSTQTAEDVKHVEGLTNAEANVEKEIIDDGLPQNLRKLYLAKTAIRGIPSSLCHHVSELVKLDMEDCKMLRELPKGMSNMKSLAKLKLSGCSMLENIQDLPRNLKELDLAGTAVKAFPPTFFKNDPPQLAILSLENCENLQKLQKGMSNLKFLVELKLSGCTVLEKIRDLPPNLKELRLDRTAIRELPSSIGDLAQLEKLDLRSCKRLRRLPEELQNLNPLDVLDLEGCTELDKLTELLLPNAREIRGTSSLATEKKAAHIPECITPENRLRKLVKKYFSRWVCMVVKGEAKLLF